MGIYQLSVGLTWPDISTTQNYSIEPTPRHTHTLLISASFIGFNTANLINKLSFLQTVIMNDKAKAILRPKLYEYICFSGKDVIVKYPSDLHEIDSLSTIHLL